VIVFRQADPRYPFLWSTASQPAARWHASGEGPAHYFADTPDGAWAELLRHEEITDARDAATLRRALWAVEVGDEPLETPALPRAVVAGGLETYERCQQYAARARRRGVWRLMAPAAALLPGGASGWQVAGGVQTSGPARNGFTIVIFEPPDSFIGWKAAEGAPPPDVLPRVRHLGAPAR
jgi:hypothetical protein